MLLKNYKGCSGNAHLAKSFEPTIRANYLQDLQAIDFQVGIRRRIAASATRYVPGEPAHGLGVLTSGVIDVTTFVLAAADTPIIGTHRFGGIFTRPAQPETGTLVAHEAPCSCPLPILGFLEGRVDTAASVDTATELTGVTGDATLIDYAATAAPDSGELYTIKEVASADTSGLEIVNGIPAKGILRVMVDPRAYRMDVAA